jgi:Uma2 family endonuclease
MISAELQVLPTSEELLSSDDTPVDNEDQNLLPNLLLLLLTHLWSSRQDWFFGVDMGVYYPTDEKSPTPIVPDAFLSLGVERKKGGKSRRSYVLWEESNVVPILTLEMVSQHLRGEYDKKMAIYRRLGVLYYIIYNPEFYQRDNKEPLMVYKLVRGEYQLQHGEPYWMPEVGLGIGRYHPPGSQEQLTWFDENSIRHLSEAEVERQRADDERQQKERERQRANDERQQKELERQQKERLAERLRELGEDPEQFL